MNVLNLKEESRRQINVEIKCIEQNCVIIPKSKIIMHEEDNSLEVFCVVSAVAKTGVEMEAIMGVNAALITIYDLSKIVNPHLRIDNVRLLIKEGGKSGLWTNPDDLPDFLKNFFQIKDF